MVGVDVFPAGEQIFVGGERPDAGGGIRSLPLSLKSPRLQGVGASHAQMRPRSRPTVSWTEGSWHLHECEPALKRSAVLFFQSTRKGHPGWRRGRFSAVPAGPGAGWVVLSNLTQDYRLSSWARAVQISGSTCFFTM